MWLAVALVGALAACTQVSGTDEAVPTATTVAPDPVDAGAPNGLQPNIVVFMTDDQTLEQMRALPLVGDLIVDEGMTFTQSVTNLPSCCPSRATFLTGQHAGNHGVLTNSGVNGGFAAFDDQETAVPVALSDAGYHTIFVGKYLNGFGILTSQRYVPPGWADFRGLVAPTEVLYHSPSFLVNGTLTDFGADDYSTDVMNEYAVDAVGDAPDAPFFAWVSYPAPHATAGAPRPGFDYLELQREAATLTEEKFLRPPGVAPRHERIYVDESVPPVPSMNEFDVSDKPVMLRRRIRDVEEFATVTDFYRAQLGSLRAVDESVADIVAAIEARDDGRDTWFFFTSDNGLLLGQHRHFGTKYFPYEESLRVPLYISGPGVAAGSSTPQLVSNVDLAPTILDIAGATPLREPDGMSLLPVLLGTEQPAGRAVLIQGFNFNASAPSYRGVHTGDSVYVEWLTGERELYDLTVDPYQLVNVVDDPDAASLLERDLRLLDELADCAGAACRSVGSGVPQPMDPARLDGGGS